MASISTGLYYIVEANDPTKCLGVKSWSSDNEANVQEHNLNKTEGQTCFVSEAEDGYIIGFPLTGKVLCVADKGAGAGRWYVGSAFTMSSDGNTDEWVQNTTGIEYAYVGDVYLNQARLTTFRCTYAGDVNHAKWTYTGNVASAVGNPTIGTRWHSGTGINSIWGGIYKTSEVANAIVGDMYLNYNSGFVFRCTKAGAPNVATWEFVADIQAARTRTDDGTNVFQHDWDGTKAEVWNIEDAGSTVVVDGQTMEAYFISTTLDTTKVLTINTGGNAVIYSRTASDTLNKKYAFVPIGSVPEGTYRLIPQVDKTVCIGVQGNSDAAGAWCVHETTNDSNNECNYQVWKVDHINDGLCSIRCAANGNALASKVSKGLYYGAVEEWIASSAELWVARMLGSASYNSDNMPTYHVAVQEGQSNLVLDAFGMEDQLTRATSLSKWACLTAGAQTLARQRYLFVPAEAYAASGVSVPTNLALMGDGAIGDNLGANGVAYVYPCWQGDGSEWQVRWCYQYRAVGDTKYCADDISGNKNGWSPYYALGDSSKANNGWGAQGYGNCTATFVNGWYIADQPIILSKLGIASGKYDGYHIYFEVRQVVHDYGELGVDAHGGTASGYMWVCWQPTIAFSNLVISPDGVSIDYTMQPVRAKNNIKISCDYFTIDAQAVKSTGTLTTSKLKAIPNVSASTIDVNLAWEITSATELTSTGSTIVQATNNMANASVLTGVQETWIAVTRRLAVQLPSGVSKQRMWLNIDGEDELIECSCIGRTFDVYYPFNRAFSLKCYAIQNNVVKTWSKSYQPQACKVRCWNWSAGGYFELAYGIGNTPQESIKTTPTVQSRKTTMRRWSLTQMGNAFDRSHSVTGALVDELYANAYAAIDALSRCKFAWYRNPEGEVIRVAVASVTANEVREGIHQISIENKRVDYDTGLE